MHHRNKRSKGVIKTELSDINGIGDKLAEKLLREFNSVKRIKEASLEELTTLIGPSKAELVMNGLKGEG
jgi:excinuclease ABC subunit C